MAESGYMYRTHITGFNSRNVLSDTDLFSKMLCNAHTTSQQKSPLKVCLRGKGTFVCNSALNERKTVFYLMRPMPRLTEETDAKIPVKCWSLVSAEYGDKVIPDRVRLDDYTMLESEFFHLVVFRILSCDSASMT